MKLTQSLAAGLLAVCAATALPGLAAELLLPQNRSAYFTGEPIELAVAGLEKGATATVQLAPAETPGQPVGFTVTGDGSTVAVKLPPNALAPGSYTLSLDNKAAGKLSVASGLWQSPLFVAQTAKGWSNFIVSNAFSFGLLDKDGQPLKEVRGKQSGTMKSYEQAIAGNQPLLCYMYWTGYVTHKPFGSMKSWANAEMIEAMRLLNFSTAQRLRKFDKAFLSIGALDEPGLSWGPTPAGGMASGFPNWDEKSWYEAKGWKYTQDIAKCSDAEWLNYVYIRGQILGDAFTQASKDIKAAWPQAIFSTDAYALHAIMDGTDSLNQLPNDIPSSHVFFDFFGGPMSVPGQMQLEKAACPQAKLAHAMNGQLVGTRGPQRPLYHLLMNGMLQGGLHSNWWLNTGGMTADDLEAVNKPAASMGALFQGAELKGYDVAVLWSFTEIAMREKEMAAKESTKTSGQQIKLMLPFPDDAEQKEFEVGVNAYEIGQQYTDPVLGIHQVLRRAGYPAQLIDERLIPDGALKNYKVLVIIGQSFTPSPKIMDGIADFVKKGGVVVVDKSTTVKFPGAVTFGADYGANAFRARNYKAAQQAKAAANKRDASKFETIDVVNNAFFRQGIAPLKAVMAKTAAKPVVVTEAPDLSVDKQLAGDGLLISVLNGHEELPQIDNPETPYPRYTPAPYAATITLPNLPKGSAVYGIEGLDWKTARLLENPAAPQALTFAPGEMKLFLVAPRAPKGLKAAAKLVNNQVQVSVTLDGVKMPWPFTVTLTGPDGKALYTVARGTEKTGAYSELFPLGANAAAGDYTVQVASVPGAFTAQAQVTVAPTPVTPALIAGAARVFDEAAIRAFLKNKPALTIAVANDAQQPIADTLAAALKAKGVKVQVKLEADVLQKKAYPRVWNPTATLFTPGGAPKPPTGEVKLKLTLATGPTGLLITDEGGKLVADWRQKSTLVTIGDGGFADWNGNEEKCYDTGCQLFVDEKGQVQVLNATGKSVPTTAEFRAKWEKPWNKLGSHVGGYQLPPQLPEAYTADGHLIVMGDSTTSQAVCALQASEMLPQIVDAKYPGPGKALVEFVWSPFKVESNVILLGATDNAGLRAAADALVKLLP